MTERASVRRLRVAVREPEPRSELHWSDLREAFAGISAGRSWTIEGVCDGAPLIVLAAPEKSGKSWIAMQLCVAAVLGERWLGRFTFRKPGPVVYLDAEYGPHEVARRIGRLTRALGREPTEVLGRLFHRYAAGTTLGFDRENGFSDEFMLDLAGEFREGAIKPALIVIDPFRAFLAGNENDSAVITSALRTAAILRTQADAPVLVLHHLNRAGSLAGSRAIRTAADLIIEGTDEAEPWFSVVGRTVRRGDAVAAGRFTVSIGHEDDDDDTKAQTILACRFEGETRAKVAALSTPARRALELFRRAELPLTATGLRKALKVSGAVAERVVSELTASGAIERQGRGWVVSTQRFLADLQPGDRGQP